MGAFRERLRPDEQSKGFLFLWLGLIGLLLVGLYVDEHTSHEFWVQFWLIAIILVLPALAATTFAIFVWPTRWKYERPSGQVVRISRFSGHAQILTPLGWRPLGDQGRLPE